MLACARKHLPLEGSEGPVPAPYKRHAVPSPMACRTLSIAVLVVIRKIESALQEFTGHVSSHENPCRDTTQPCAGTGGVVGHAAVPQQQMR